MAARRGGDRAQARGDPRDTQEARHALQEVVEVRAQEDPRQEGDGPGRDRHVAKLDGAVARLRAPAARVLEAARGLQVLDEGSQERLRRSTVPDYDISEIEKLIDGKLPWPRV